MTKELELTQGKVALVDDEDYEELSKRSWYFNNGYAVRYKHHPRVSVYLHRVIMDCPSGMQVDHINGDKLDNRRENLRVCTQKENTRNAKLKNRNKSGYKGVSWNKNKKRWVVQITANDKDFFVGLFKDVIEAARAYDKKAKELHGEFARTNF